MSVPRVNGLDIRERARAAGAYLEMHRDHQSGELPEDMEMVAFMAVFHPEIKGKRLRKVIKKDKQ